MSRQFAHMIREYPPKTLGRQQGKKALTDSLRAITEATYIKLTKLKTADNFHRYAPLKRLRSEKQINFGPVPLITHWNVGLEGKNWKTRLQARLSKKSPSRFLVEMQKKWPHKMRHNQRSHNYEGSWDSWKPPINYTEGFFDTLGRSYHDNLKKGDIWTHPFFWNFL